VALLTEYLVVFEGPARPGSSAATVEGDPMANSDKPNRRQFIVRSLAQRKAQAWERFKLLAPPLVDQTDWHE
jgi:hypothetical protein